MHDEQTRDRFIELRALNWSFDRIAQELKVTQSTLVIWSRQFQQDIQNLRAIPILVRFYPDLMPVLCHFHAGFMPIPSPNRHVPVFRHFRNLLRRSPLFILPLGRKAKKCPSRADFPLARQMPHTVIVSASAQPGPAKVADAPPHCGEYK